MGYVRGPFFLKCLVLLLLKSRIFSTHLLIKHLVAFGTHVTCFIPSQQGEGGKTPGQKKFFEGVVIGYVEGMKAYRVWDIKQKKIKEVSFYFSVVSEGYFPF